jgi:hypothetical protein
VLALGARALGLAAVRCVGLLHQALRTVQTENKSKCKTDIPSSLIGMGTTHIPPIKPGREGVPRSGVLLILVDGKR